MSGKSSQVLQRLGAANLYYSITIDSNQKTLPCHRRLIG